MFVYAGFPGWHNERSTADGVFWRATSLGEDSGEDGRCWAHAWPRLSLDCVVGKVHRSCWQHFYYEWVCRLLYVQAAWIISLIIIAGCNSCVVVWTLNAFYRLACSLHSAVAVQKFLPDLVIHPPQIKLMVSVSFIKVWRLYCYFRCISFMQSARAYG